MTLVPCPSCSRAVSHRAETCVHCGYDLMPPPADAVPERPARVRRGRLILGALAGALALLAVLGSFISMAAPRMAPPAGGVAVAETTAADALALMLELQQEHYAHHGAYTANIADPAAADFLEGFDASLVPAGHEIEVVEAGAEELCVQVRPAPGTPAADASPVMTIDENGALRHSRGCTGEIALAPPRIAAS